MTRAELSTLRDDALAVIIELYRMPPADRLGNADRQFALHRAIAMHEAAIRQLDQWDVEPNDAIRMNAANSEYDRLKDIETLAYRVAHAWRANAPLNRCSNYALFNAVEFLADKLPQEGGA